MTSDRPHRRALSYEVSVSELIRGSGPQFDATAVEAFLALDSAKSHLAVSARESLHAQV
jgi:HD-GYP domain-containing protein (c-di-GMP phosphodiesterase class II)